MCQTSESFQELFLNFFFPDICFNNIQSFTREFSREDSRVDFYIENNGNTYIIECKINDKNHHFEQYTNAYNIKNECLGYITNYQYSKSGFNIKTWEELYDYIIENLPQEVEEKRIYEGYLEYLRQVCGIIKIKKKMELNGIYSLYSFNVILKSVINRNTANFKLSYYNSDFKESYYGYKFKVESINKKNIWLNVGLWFSYEKPVITIGALNKEGWGKPLYDKIINENNYPFKYAAKRYKEESFYYFEGSNEFYFDFENACNIEEQKNILCEFVDEVINYYIQTD